MMKKLLTLLLAAVLALSLAACGDHPDVKEKTTSDLSPAADNPGHYEAPTPVWGGKTTEPAAEPATETPEGGAPVPTPNATVPGGMTENNPTPYPVMPGGMPEVGNP